MIFQTDLLNRNRAKPYLSQDFIVTDYRIIFDEIRGAGVVASQIVRWKKELEQSAPDIFSGKQEKAAQDGQRLKDELYRQIGQLKVELDWVKKIWT